MQKKERKSKVAAEMSIRDGWVFTEDVCLFRLESHKFKNLLETGVYTAFRVISLQNHWIQHVWIDSTTILKEELNMQMTLRREIRNGSGYWYAYRRVFGKLHKRYVGRDFEICEARLIEVARKLPCS